MRSQGYRQYGYSGIQAHSHQSIDNRLRNEVVSVNPTVDNQSCCNNCRVSAGQCQFLCHQRQFESPGHVEDVNLFR
ncbi:hypothetical protein D3C76_1775020 [compost metagenome]